MPEQWRKFLLSEPEIYSLIHATLELPQSYRLKPETRIADVPGWDSLGWVSVITAIESECGVEFDSECIDDLKTVADLVKCVHKSENV